MKKTIIAASIAAVVAAPAAFAQASISGQINQEFYKTDGGELSTDRNADIVVKASETLDNGMTAFATLSLVNDAGTASGQTTSSGATNGTGIWGESSTQIVGLATDFGTITMGKQELFIESKAAAMAANDASDYLTNEVATSYGETAEASVEYTSPSMGGFKVVLSAAGGSQADSSATTNTDDLEVTGFGVEYSNAGLLVRAATADDNGRSSNVLGVQYSMGDLKMGVVTAEEDTAARQTWYGASYKMGANELAVSTVDSDTASAEDTIVSLKHSMSKSVAVYLAHEADGAANSDTTLVGMQVKF
jgi:hypothetical protein